MPKLLTKLDAMGTAESGLGRSDHHFLTGDILAAIGRFHLHKSDGGCGLSTDHFLHADSDLACFIDFLFTCMIVHGSAPSGFGASSIIPIPKKHNINVADSNNCRGIALGLISFVFCKLFDNVIPEKFHANLCPSDLQFGFKSKHSTSICTMVLKETINYYVTNNSSAKEFDRVHYCKLFRLLVKRGLPPCIVRILINLYNVNQVRVLWVGLASDYFAALNGVKQGGMISTILFCIYIDDLTRLSTSAWCWLLCWP